MAYFEVLQGVLLSIAFILNSSFGTAMYFCPLDSRVTSILISHQCMVDACLCFINLLINTVPHPTIEAIMVSYNQFVCHVWITQWIYWHFVQMSVQNLVCIALDRYMAVVKASIYKEKQKFLLIFSFVYIWTIASVVAFPVALQYTIVNGTCIPIADLKNHAIDSTFKVFAVIWFVTCYFLPTLFFVFVYSNIIKIIKSLKSAEGDNTMRVRFTTSAFIVTCFFVVLYSYDTTYYLLGNMAVVVYTFGSDIQKVGVLMITMNSFINPTIYLAMMKPMRQRYVKFYMKLFHCPASMRRENREVNVTKTDH